MRTKKSIYRYSAIVLLIILLFPLVPINKQVAYAGSDKFLIDSAEVYPNMDTAYQDGYSPMVKEGKAMIVLPLIYEDTAWQPDSVTASVDFGNIAGSPFEIKQYKKDFKPDNYNLPSGHAKRAFLVEFGLGLKNNRMNGTYLVNIEIQYKMLQMTEENASFITEEQVFPVYVTITDGTEPGNGSEHPGGIKLKLESCNINPQEIKLGSTFSVTAKLLNTSQSMDIKNMQINYSNSEGILTPTGNIGSVYLDRLGAGQSGTVQFEMKAAVETTNFNPKITLDIQYEDKNGNTFTDTEIIYITLQPATNDSGGPKSNLFEIEGDHTFTGMDSSYHKGYVPEVAKGKAKVVMPLSFIGDGSIYGDVITASIGYTDLQNSPFLIKSYSKKIIRKKYDSKEGDKLNLYLADFTLDLKADRMNGVYPVNINIRYELNSEVKEQTFTVYIVIQDGKDPNATEPPEQPKPIPKLIITSCTTDPKVAHTGDIITFRVDIKNTNKSFDVRNIKLNYASDTGDMILAKESNSIYIDEMKAGQTDSITFQMKVMDEISTGNQKITLTINGEDENGATVSDTESLYLSVELPFRIKIEKPVLANEMESGKTQTISFPIMNTGKTKIVNIACVLEMDGVISSGAYFLGELAPAASEQASLQAVIANKKITDPSVAENEKYGFAAGTITVTYEDAAGKSYQEIIEVSTSITKPEDEEGEKGEINSQWWISVITGLIIIQAIIVLALFTRKKRSIS
jgi:hypothetical protein